jgi:hypothetical protein
MNWERAALWPLLVIAVVLTYPGGATADTYRVNVTRKAQDFYEETQTRIIIKTRYCYEYVYYEDAILEWDGRTGRLVFIESGGGECDVDRILK